MTVTDLPTTQHPPLGGHDGAGDGRTASRPGVMQRITQILDLFTSENDTLLLSEITDATGIPRSTAFRMLDQLVDLQWIEHDSRGYRLGFRIPGIGRGESHTGLRSAASEALNELQSRTGGVAHLTVLEGADVYFLDKIGGAVNAAVPSKVGARLPAHTTVSGRALLACLEPERVDAMMAAPSAATVVRVHDLLNQIRRRNGIAFVPDSECSLGMTAVAAPVIGPDGVVGAISVAKPDRVPLGVLAPMVWSAARQTSRNLFPGRAPRATQQSPGTRYIGRELVG